MSGRNIQSCNDRKIPLRREPCRGNHPRNRGRVICHGNRRDKACNRETGDNPLRTDRTCIRNSRVCTRRRPSPINDRVFLFLVTMYKHVSEMWADGKNEIYGRLRTLADGKNDARSNNRVVLPYPVTWVCGFFYYSYPNGENVILFVKE